MIAAFRINVFFDFNLNILFLCFFLGGAKLALLFKKGLAVSGGPLDFRECIGNL
jgi:hypothetical protein